LQAHKQLQKMNTEDNYLHINRQSWNNVVDIHWKSEFYNLEDCNRIFTQEEKNKLYE